MCLSTVINVDEGKQEEICDHVSNAEVDGDKLTFTDIMGAETVFTGRIVSVDLVENKILVASA
ncbi:MAG: CooT family nickel-binding protein [Coriobacteriales bacterium]|jgi:predicted RNA-binding protein